MRPTVTMKRLRILALCWAGIFIVVMGRRCTHAANSLGRAVPDRGLVRRRSCIHMVRLLLPTRGRGPRERWWMYFRFVTANWTRVHIIIARGERGRPVQVGQRAFDRLLQRTQERQK